MHLPPHIANCIHALEQAGFPAYAVGGCVRDALLGLPPHDYDLCTAATPSQIQAVFTGYDLVLAGQKHGTVGVITSQGVVEITTFRTEGTYRDHRHPDAVSFIDSVDGDLARRDFTINAMAYAPTRGFADPFGGREDLKNQVLRAVGEPQKRFQEDALRILRGVRFAARFSLTVEENTLAAMKNLAPLLDELARERVFDELCKLLLSINAGQMQTFAPILAQAIPELAPTLGFDQKNTHHAYDLFTHIAHVVDAVPPILPLRWAALLHDIGKPDTFSVDSTGAGHFYGHAARSAQMADEILRRLKSPTALRQQVGTLIGQHMTKIEPEKKPVRRWLSRLGKEDLQLLLLLQEADMGSKGTGKPAEIVQFDHIRSVVAEIEAESACLSVRDLAVNGHDLMALGLTGPKIGQTLQQLLEQVLDEALPNEKEALLRAIKSR